MKLVVLRLRICRMHSFLVDSNSEYKKAKGVNRNIVAYKDVLLNSKCIIHPMNRIQSKDHKKELIKSAKFHCLISMTKYISKTIDTMD